MYSEILLCFGLSVVCIILFFHLGAIFNSQLKLVDYEEENFCSSIFANTIVGIFFTVIFYAIITCHSKTIFSGAFILLILYLYFIWRQNKLPHITKIQWGYPKELSPLLFTGLIFIGSFIAITWQIFPNGIKDYVLTWFDYHYYANLTKGLNKLGLENPRSSFYQFYQPHGTFLYHYFDLWLNALIVKIFKVNSLNSLLFIVYPVLLFLSITGTISVAARFFQGKIKWWHLPVIVLLMIAANAHWGMLKWGMMYYPGYYYQHKILINYLFILLAITALQHSKPLLFVFWMIAVCFAYATSLPGIAAGSGLFILFGFYYFYKDKSYPHWQVIFMLLFGVGFCVLFDKFTAEEPRKALDINNIPHLKTIVVLMVEFGIKWCVSYLSLVLILIRLAFIDKSIRSNILILQLLVFVVGAFGGTAFYAALNHRVADINQVMYNILPPLLTALSVAVFGYYLFQGGEHKIVKVSVVVVLCCLGISQLIYDTSEIKAFDSQIHRYSDRYIDRSLAELNKFSMHSPPKVVLLSGNKIQRWEYNFYQVAPFVTNNNFVGNVIDITPYFADSSYVFCSAPENSLDPVCNLMQRKSVHLIDSIPPLDDFLLNQKVTHIVIGNKSMVSRYKIKDKTTLIATDSSTGELFYRVTE